MKLLLNEYLLLLSPRRTNSYSMHDDNAETLLLGVRSLPETRGI
jgi:hypothetical protein